jgi:hypothetical protein
MTMRLLAIIAATMLASSAALACPAKTVCLLELTNTNPSQGAALAKILGQFDKADWQCIEAAKTKPDNEALAMALCLQTNGWTVQY